jgi:hypothetical protein
VRHDERAAPAAVKTQDGPLTHSRRL